MITREQLDGARADYDHAKMVLNWFSEASRGRNNESLGEVGSEFVDAVFPLLCQRMMWEWLVRGLSPEVALRETLELFDRRIQGSRDVIEQGLQVFYLMETGALA